ncbi:MAG: hypothetical protein HYS13_04915 [Planctomycetia bacterium]|nr:hypothetical protein [Planctomycetia bacterium]
MSVAPSKPAPFITYIASVAPSKVRLLREIPVTIRPENGCFVATFFDAGISSAGDSPEDAFDAVKSLIVDIFEGLNKTPAHRLGPHPRRQLHVLRDFLRKSSWLKPSSKPAEAGS